jgi:AcrR family transcriptional regulator
MKDNHDAKREAIIEAAFEVIAAKGYFETKVEDIAQRAGVAKGTVYLHFKDKPDIYIGLVEWLFEQAVATIREIDARPLSPREKLLEIYTTWAEYVFARPGAMGLLSTENPQAHIESSAHDRLKQAMVTRMRDMMSGLAGIVRQGIEAGEFRNVDPVMAGLMFALSFRSSVMAARHELGVREPRAAAFNILLNGILKPVSGNTAQESK